MCADLVIERYNEVMGDDGGEKIERILSFREIPGKRGGDSEKEWHTLWGTGDRTWEPVLPLPRAFGRMRECLNFVHGEGYALTDDVCFCAGHLKSLLTNTALLKRSKPSRSVSAAL